MEPNLILRWIECHPAIAGWMQVFGVMVAVVATILVTKWQISSAAAKDIREQRTKARALAYLLSPSIARLLIALQRIEQTIQETDSGMTLVTPGPFGEKDAIEAMTFREEGDAALLHRIEAFPGDIALRIVQFFSFTSDFDSYVRKFMALTEDPEVHRLFAQDIDAKFAVIKSIAQLVKADIDSVVQGG